MRAAVTSPINTTGHLLPDISGAFCSEIIPVSMRSEEF